MLSALILDFDGLILDTEWPGYLGWQETYAAHGFSFSEEVWAGFVGTAHHADPAAELQRLIREQGGTPPPLADLHVAAHERREALIYATDRPVRSLGQPMTLEPVATRWGWSLPDGGGHQ